MVLKKPRVVTSSCVCGKALVIFLDIFDQSTLDSPFMYNLGFDSPNIKQALEESQKVGSVFFSESLVEAVILTGLRIFREPISQASKSKMICSAYGCLGITFKDMNDQKLALAALTADEPIPSTHSRLHNVCVLTCNTMHSRSYNRNISWSLASYRHNKDVRLA